MTTSDSSPRREAAMDGTMQPDAGSHDTKSSPQPPEPGEASHSDESRAVSALVQAAIARPVTWILVGLVVIAVVFTILAPANFTTLANFQNICTDAAVLLVLAVGSTFVIVTGGIDLSIGAVLVFASVISVKVMDLVGGNGPGAILFGLVAAIAAGTLWGVLNGVLVARLRIPPLIATLSTLGMAIGAAFLITGGNDISNIPPFLVSVIGAGKALGVVPWLVVIAAAVAVVAAIVLTQTRFGRYTYAIGSNSQAARRASVRVDLHLIKVYGMASALAGLAGFLSLAQFDTTDVGGHTTDNLTAITAVVLGGTSLFGGVGSIAGTVIGVLIPTVLQNGFVIVNIPPYWQEVALGPILIGAVYLDQLRRRAQER